MRDACTPNTHAYRGKASSVTTPELCGHPVLWLHQFLQGGRCDVSKIQAAARSAGISRAELKEARRKLGAVVTHSRSRFGDAWYWELP